MIGDQQCEPRIANPPVILTELYELDHIGYTRISERTQRALVRSFAGKHTTSSLFFASIQLFQSNFNHESCLQVIAHYYS